MVKPIKKPATTTAKPRPSARSKPKAAPKPKTTKAAAPKLKLTKNGFLFEGKDVIVAYRPVEGAKQLVVTFTGRGALPSNGGFGENFFFKNGVAGIHFMSTSSHWWQTDDVSQAIAVVKKYRLMEGYERVIAYGASMGGYAAIIRSAELGVDHVIAVSPQYSLDRKVVPFEKRWQSNAANLTFNWDDMPAGMDLNCRMDIFVDPFFKPDLEHIKLFEKIRPIERINVNFANHVTLRVLEECGMMQKIVLQLIDGSFTPRVYEQEYRKAKQSSCLFWLGFAQALIATGREAWAFAPAAIAADMVIKGARMRTLDMQIEIMHLAIKLACKSGRLEQAKAWLSWFEQPQAARHTLAKDSHLRVGEFENSAQVQLKLTADYLEARPTDSAAALLHMRALSAVDDKDGLQKMAAVAKKFVAVPDILALYAEKMLAAGQDGAFAYLYEACKRHGKSVPLRLLLARQRLEKDEIKSAQRALLPILVSSVGSAGECESICDLARKAGLKQMAKKFSARCDRLNLLNRLTLENLSIIGVKTPNKDALKFSRAVQIALWRKLNRPKST